MRTLSVYSALFAVAFGTIACCAGTCDTCFAQSTPTAGDKWDKPAEEAYTRVRTAPFFAGGEVGIAGAFSEERKALDVLVQHKDALPLLEGLLKGDQITIEGTLYALQGLVLLQAQLRRQEWVPGKETREDRQARLDAFENKVDGYLAKYRKSSDTTAQVMRGCVVGPRRVSLVVQELQQPVQSFHRALDPPKTNLLAGAAAENVPTVPQTP